MTVGTKEKLSEEVKKEIEQTPVFQSLQRKINQLPQSDQPNAQQALEHLVCSLVFCQAEALGWIAALKELLEKSGQPAPELSNIANALF